MLLRALGAEKQRLSLCYAQCVEFYRYFAPLPPNQGATQLAYFYKKRARAPKLHAQGAIAAVILYFTPIPT